MAGTGTFLMLFAAPAKHLITVHRQESDVTTVLTTFMTPTVRTEAASIEEAMDKAKTCYRAPVARTVTTTHCTAAKH